VHKWGDICTGHKKPEEKGDPDETKTEKTIIYGFHKKSRKKASYGRMRISRDNHQKKKDDFLLG